MDFGNAPAFDHYNCIVVCRVTAVGGHYQIGIYSVRKIQYGEEITFDYNSVTEVCLIPLLAILYSVENNLYTFCWPCVNCG